MRHAATMLQRRWLHPDGLRALLLRRSLLLCMGAVLGWTAASVPAAAQPASSLFADLGADAVTFAPSPLSKTGEPAWITAPIPAEATGFVVQGATPDRNLTGWVRFENGPWRTLHIVFSATGDTFFAGFHGEDVFAAGRFEIRFETRASVALTAAGVFDNREDANRDEGPSRNAAWNRTSGRRRLPKKPERIVYREQALSSPLACTTGKHGKPTLSGAIPWRWPAPTT